MLMRKKSADKICDDPALLRYLPQARHSAMVFLREVVSLILTRMRQSVVSLNKYYWLYEGCIES